MEPTKSRIVLWCALVVVAAVAPHVGHDAFVHDDHVVVEHNPQASWPPDLGALWRGRWFGEGAAYRHVGVSRPLVMLSYSLEHGLGLGHPAARHAVQLALYVALCLLAWGLLRRLAAAAGLVATTGEHVAGAAALGFALHPTHAEVVGSLANRPEILALLCTLGATWLLLQLRVGEGSRTAAVGAVLLFAAGLWCKESALGAWLAWALWAWAARARRLLAPLATMALVAAMWLVWRKLTFGALTAVGVPPTDNPLVLEATGVRVLNALALGWRALGHLAWPSELAPDYTFAAWPVLRQCNSEVVAGGLVGLAVVGGLSWALWPSSPVPARAAAACEASAHEVLAVLGRRELLVLGLGWTVAHWLPVSNLLFPSTVLFADRLLTASSLGCAVLLALPLTVADLPRPMRLLRWLPLLLVAPLWLGWTWQLGRRVWVADGPLFEAGVARQPNSVRMRYDLAFWQSEHGELDAARHHLAVAARLQPRDPDVLVLGLELARGAHCADAAPHLQVLASARGPAVKPRQAAAAWALDCKTFGEAWPLVRLLPPTRVDGDWPLRVYVVGVAAGDEVGARRWAQAFVPDPAHVSAWVSAAAFADEQVGKLASAAKRLQDLQRAQPQLTGLDAALAALRQRHPELAALPAEVSATHGNP